MGCKANGAPNADAGPPPATRTPAAQVFAPTSTGLAVGRSIRFMTAPLTPRPCSYLVTVDRLQDAYSLPGAFMIGAVLPTAERFSIATLTVDQTIGCTQAIR